MCCLQLPHLHYPSLGNCDSKKIFLAGRVDFLQFDTPGMGTGRQGWSRCGRLALQLRAAETITALQARSAWLPARHQMPKNGLQERQESGQDLSALTHRKPRGRDRPDTAVPQKAASFPGAAESHFFPTAIYYRDPSSRFIYLQLFIKEKKKKEGKVTPLCVNMAVERCSALPQPRSLSQTLRGRGESVFLGPPPLSEGT